MKSPGTGVRLLSPNRPCRMCGDFATGQIRHHKSCYGDHEVVSFRQQQLLAMFKQTRNYSLNNWRYRQLFWSIVVLFLFTSFVQHSELGLALSQCLFALTIYLLLRTMIVPPVWYWILRGLVLVALLTSLAVDFFPSLPLSGNLKIFSDVVFVTFLGLAVIIIARQINRATQVDRDILVGSVCVYLLLGIFWYLLYRILITLQPDSFASLTDQDGTEFSLLYFSFTTLTTLGYGDISPTNPISMSLANFEAIVGQLYPAITIARLVGLYGMRNNGSDNEDQPQP